jgi:cytoskeletal protein RodZ
MSITNLLLLFLLFLIPFLLAHNRNHNSKGLILILSMLLGFTIIGWFVALLWAAYGKTSQEVEEEESSELNASKETPWQKEQRLKEKGESLGDRIRRERLQDK